MIDRLSEHLARQGGARLEPLLDAAVVDLLRHVGPDALAPSVMAELIVASKGAVAVLHDEGMRKILLEKFDDDEVTALCAVLRLQTGAARMALANANLNPTIAESFFEWFGVPYEQPDRREDLSRNIVSTSKLSLHQEAAYLRLRPMLDMRSNRALVHMPLGAGKLRTVSTAVLESFRATGDGKSILWLAPGDCLCEEASRELETVWEQLGLRDVTSYRLFDGRRTLPPRDAANAFVIAEIESLLRLAADRETQEEVAATLEEFGTSIRHIVLADAEHISVPGVRRLLEIMGRRGDWTLIGISASSPTAIGSAAQLANLVAAYADNVVTMTSKDPLATLREDGTVAFASVEEMCSPVGSLDGADNPVGLPAATLNSLSLDLERNKALLAKLVALSREGVRLAFYATTARQARTFERLLILQGIGVVSVTSEMEPSRRAQELARFDGERRHQVLSLHGVLVSSSEVAGVDAVVLALPATSGALLHEMIGRLASDREPSSPPLRVYAMADPVPGWLRLVRNLERWTDLKL